MFLQFQESTRHLTIICNSSGQCCPPLDSSGTACIQNIDIDASETPIHIKLKCKRQTIGTTGFHAALICELYSFTMLPHTTSFQWILPALSVFLLGLKPSGRSLKTASQGHRADFWDPGKRGEELAAWWAGATFQMEHEDWECSESSGSLGAEGQWQND